MGTKETDSTKVQHKATESLYKLKDDEKTLNDNIRRIVEQNNHIEQSNKRLKLDIESDEKKMQTFCKMLCEYVGCNDGDLTETLSLINGIITDYDCICPKKVVKKLKGIKQQTGQSTISCDSADIFLCQ